MENTFDSIYKNRIWACGDVLSGAGSDPIGAAEYIKYLQKFNNRFVLDLGCGDLSLYNRNPSFKNYIGVDIVDIRKYKTIPTNIQLIYSSILDFDYKKYTFDLIILKDVLQHLPYEEIFQIFDKIYDLECNILITNDFDKNILNFDCKRGECRQLNLEITPFSMKYEEIFDWISGIDGRLKRTYLI